MDRDSPLRPDGRRIDLADTSAVRYWAEQFGVTEQEIREAVEAAGGDVGAVRERLARNRSY
jgi:NACalpha-BTF3-like transcription factor